MKRVYARDLDLNLLRVLVAVADTGSVTGAAAQLYLTQPAVSAALRRLTTTLEAPLVTRQGRGIALTERGARLVADVRPHLDAMIDAAVAPPKFDAKTSTRTVKLGLADSAEAWLLPSLLRLLERQAPLMRLVCLPIQFRTVGEALATRRIDVAVTVADELPRTIARRKLFYGGFVCLYDPRHAKLGRRPSERTYFAHEHVIVSYNGDLRGVIEDAFGKQRNVRVSIASFNNVGAIVEGSALVATIPAIVAHPILKLRPHLRTAKVPFDFPENGMELLWPTALDGDDAHAFLRDAIARVSAQFQPKLEGRR
jgi:LysR family transcriptional activator of mexEF-oprN operon